MRDIFARPDGRHYHTNRNCTMLGGGDFEKMGYVKIDLEEVGTRELYPCHCVYKSVDSEILRFAMEMEHTQMEYDSLKGDSWKDCNIDYLGGKLKEEVQEYFDLVEKQCPTCGHDVTELPREPDQIRRELVDIANIAMFLWYRADEMGEE